MGWKRALYNTVLQKTVMRDVVHHGVNNIRLPFIENIISPAIRQSIQSGEYEAGELAIAKSIIRSDDRVIELGAGIGFLSSSLFQRARPQSYLAIEADPRLIPLIKRTFQLNRVGGVEVLNCVATDDPHALAAGQVMFAQHEEFWSSRVTGADGLAVPVPARSLNAILKQRDATVLICDIEGGEASLFPKLDISEIRALIIEVHPALLTSSEMRTIFDRAFDAGLTYDERSLGRVVAFVRS